MLDTSDNTPACADQPQSHGTTGRRMLALGGMATAIAGLMGVMLIDPAVAANANADADGSDLVLVQLCARIVTDCSQQAALQTWMYGLLPDDDDYDMVSRRILELDDETRQLAVRVGKLPAHTAEGIQARAAAIKALMPVDFDLADWVPINWHGGMLDALLRDLTREA